jgi:uncharacterized protein YkwD
VTVTRRAKRRFSLALAAPAAAVGLLLTAQWAIGCPAGSTAPTGASAPVSARLAQQGPGRRDDTAAAKPATLTAAEAAAVNAAGAVAASTAPPKVSGKYVIRGPSTAPRGATVVCALSGPTRLVLLDTTKPYQVTVDTTKLKDGQYTVTVLVRSSGPSKVITSRKIVVDNSGSGGGTGTFADQVVKMVNDQRLAAGCKALAVNPILTSVAQAHSQDMADHDYFDHNSQDGTTPFQRMTKAGYKYTSAGENIAAGQPTPADVMDAWMHSDGHKANILNCGYTEIGVGYATGVGRYHSYWTQDFGTPR